MTTASRACLINTTSAGRGRQFSTSANGLYKSIATIRVEYKINYKMYKLYQVHTCQNTKLSVSMTDVDDDDV